jgi:hypothetical protein
LKRSTAPAFDKLASDFQTFDLEHPEAMKYDQNGVDELPDPQRGGIYVHNPTLLSSIQPNNSSALEVAFTV